MGPGKSTLIAATLTATLMSGFSATAAEPEAGDQISCPGVKFVDITCEDETPKARLEVCRTEDGENQTFEVRADKRSVNDTITKLTGQWFKTLRGGDAGEIQAQSDKMAPWAQANEAFLRFTRSCHGLKV